MERTNWLVRVYMNQNDEDPITFWTIENRTESEASSEAMADIAREWADAWDWSLTPQKNTLDNSGNQA